jgi:hypothetical protein
MGDAPFSLGSGNQAVDPYPGLVSNQTCKRRLATVFLRDEAIRCRSKVWFVAVNGECPFG